MSAGDLAAETEVFAASVQRMLDGVLPGVHEVVIVQHESQARFSIRPAGASSPWVVPLFVADEPLASLGFQYHLALDHRDRYLKVTGSNFSVWPAGEREPLLRCEFLANARNAPTAHWQFHAHRGAFSHLLSRSHAARPNMVRTAHELSKLHLPVGGPRFRPCLEDVLEMLVVDCGIDAKRQWRSVINSGRRDWREKQVASVVRDAPDIAASALAALGWKLTPPIGGDEGVEPRNLTRW